MRELWRAYTQSRQMDCLLTTNSEPLAKRSNKHLRETQNPLQGEWWRRLFAHLVGLKAFGQLLRAHR